eukprot:12918041-Prorocentrum_lima.AAC.1
MSTATHGVASQPGDAGSKSDRAITGIWGEAFSLGALFSRDFAHISPGAMLHENRGTQAYSGTG